MPSYPNTAQNPEIEPAESSTIDLVIEAAHRQVSISGRQVALRDTEFRILRLLAREPNRIFTRTEILDGINLGDYAVGERAVDVQIVSLRKKLGSAASRIETVRGQGYRFRGLPPASSTS
jgi:two-component system phosphate regulon response regulator PhoB